MASNSAGCTEGAPSLALLVQQRCGRGFQDALLKIWSEEALPKAEKAKMEHFLSLAEESPQAAPCEKHAETTAEHMVEFLYKLVLYAPEEWYEVISGLERPEDMKNDYKSIGVAFDASSRLRRAGVEYYHVQQSARMHRMTPALSRFQQTALVYHVAAEGREVAQADALPEVPTNAVRVVAVSDTHLLHSSLVLPKGDILVHAGDLSYEESRSRDGATFDSYVKKGEPLSGKEFYTWFDNSGLQLADALRWLGSMKTYARRVLIGGNHDYILEQLGPENAERLCHEEYGITYLHTEGRPRDLPIPGISRPVSVWGSGVSFAAGVSAGRAVKSGNVAFQLGEEEGEALLRRFMPGGSSELHPGSVDVMLTHSPPAGCLLGKAGQAAEALGQLVKAVRPSLFVCGHSHHPNDPLKDTVADLDGIIGVNASCLGTWNHLHGLPVVVDLRLPRLERLGWLGVAYEDDAPPSAKRARLAKRPAAAKPPAVAKRPAAAKRPAGAKSPAVGKRPAAR